MKFKFRPSINDLDLSKLNVNKHARLKGKNTLRAVKCKKLVQNYCAEDFGAFSEPARSKKAKARLSKIFKRIWARLRENKRKYAKNSRISPITLFGALCGALSVAMISAVIVVFSLFFGHLAPYTEISVPNLISMTEQDAVAYRTDLFEYTVVYKSNPDISSNTVTAQNPSPDITRKLYGKGEKIKITLTVNTEQSAFTLPNIVGASLRETLILLKKENVTVNVIKQYSSSVPYGKIISSSVSANTVMKEGDKITIRASLGKEITFSSVPSLIGLNEYQAAEKLRLNGLNVGEISYQASKSPIGTVISQSASEGVSLKEQSKVSIVLSGGIYYEN